MTRSKSKKEKTAAELQLADQHASAATSNGKEYTSSPTVLPPPSSSALIICRNKHWRYISSFHGPWLQLPPEVLESLAYSNYSAPRPRPIDPAVFFDLLKIRRHVDEATTLAVRAASGVASSLPQKDHHLLLGIGGSGPAPRLSRERKHRMRELATQKLAKAYKLDEIAASVATMQSASSLEDVAYLVLQREARNSDAQYVHFFHEKIPSRMLAKCTSLTPLDQVISEKPAEGAPLRTRAVTRVFKDDFLGAAGDLTKALSLAARDSHHNTATLERGGRMADDEMPSSLEVQLLFHRASTYLSLAVQSAERVLAAPPDPDADRKAVRTYTKRALRDYSRFLGSFEYTPGDTEPPQLLLTDGDSSSASSTISNSRRNTNLAVYPIAALFWSPAPQLPPPAEGESLCYHPLLTDALYSTLLCHLLLATPRKELGRYVAMVARLARLADGYPVFLAARSPARADWGEVVKKCGLDELEEEKGAGEGRLQGEYPVSTERAGIVSRWVREAAGGMQGLKKRKSGLSAVREAEKKAEAEEEGGKSRVDELGIVGLGITA